MKYDKTLRFVQLPNKINITLKRTNIACVDIAFQCYIPYQSAGFQIHRSKTRTY